MEVKFGKKNEPSFFLEKSKDLIAVRTRDNQPISTKLSATMPAGIASGELVLQFPDAGLEVYRVPPGQQSVNTRKTSLRGLPEVRFAGSALVDRLTGEPVIYTENIFIKFIDSLDEQSCLAILHAAGLTVKQRPAYAANAYFAAAKEGSGTQVFQTALDLLRRKEVEYCHPELLRQRKRRAIHPNQWHLKKTTISYQAEIDASANVEAAHRLSQGEGVVIAVIDDGVDIEHPEFALPGKIVAPADVSDPAASTDPRPKEAGDNHGTAVAGVACASGRYGASGVAPKARLMPIRLASDLGSMAEAFSFLWAANQGADVICCSWGPSDGAWFDPADPLHHQVAALPASTRLAMDYAVQQGRGGKGCVIFFAAGNGNESVDNDGYASYEKVTAVAACNEYSRRSIYSDYGHAIWCAFPSADITHPDPSIRPEPEPDGRPPRSRGIWTSDRSGGAGYNSGSIDSGDQWGNYTDDFGGTSSACPGAAGVAALILAAHPALGWQEVRNIIAQSCDKISHPGDGEGGQYDGKGHSRFYGYGRVNAENAVLIAKQLAQAEPQPAPALSVD